MEGQYQWEYTGVYVVPNLQGGGSIERPFHIISAGGVDDEQLTNEEIDAAVLQLADQWMSVFESSDPTRRVQFGPPSQIFLTSIVLVPI